MDRGRLREIIRFLIAGAAGFAVELGTLILLKEKLGMDTLIATPIAFLISVIVNYILCVRWVFVGAKEQKNAAKLGFLITSVMGLLLNEGLMWLFRAMFGEDSVVLTVFGFVVTMYMVNKCLATVIVMVWNYFTKRYILKKSG